MARPITLFTGQWADLPLAELAPLAKKMGYDGLELACWGDHFDVGRRWRRRATCQDKRELLRDHGLQCFAIGNHLVGQAVCDLDRRAPPGDRAGARVGRRRSRRRAPARRARDAGHRARGGALRREDGDRLHRLADLACGVRLPADVAGLHRPRLRRLRRALDADPRHLRAEDVELRAGGAPDRDRVRHRLGPARARGAAAATAASASTSTRATSPTRASTTSRFIRTFGDAHLQRAHEGRVVGQGRRHRRRVRRPHRASATRAGTGTSAASAAA